MSDYSQGPGYWRASDGKWYPPQNDAPPATSAFDAPQQNVFGAPTQNPYGQPPQQNQYGQPQQNPYGAPQQNPYGQTPYTPPGSFGQPMFPGQGQPMYGGQGPGYVPAPSTGTSGLAIASFVLGILWLCGVGSIFAIIFGFIALASIRGTNQSGKGFAIAGIVLGFVSIAITVIVVATTAIIFHHATNSIGTATEKKDFAITSCGRDETSQFGTAVVTVTNHSRKTSDYWVEINFVEAGTVVDTGGGIVFATTVSPGESAQIDLSGDKELAAVPICQIGSFDRFEATDVLPDISVPATTG